MEPELLIHFTDVSVCLNDLKDRNIKISPKCRNHIKLLHSSVMIVTNGMPENLIAEICYRTANRVVKHIEFETGIRFVKYKPHRYKLS